MAKIEITANGFSLEITSGIQIQPDETRFLDLVKSLGTMNDVIPLDSFTVEQSLSEPTEYNYTFSAQDGREWQQNLFILPTGTEMTFDVSDPWKVSEFINHRPIRDAVDVLIRQWQVTKIEATW